MTATAGQPEPTSAHADDADAVRRMDEAAPLSDERLAEIEGRANRGCRCDDHDCVSDFVQLVDEDVPALVAEVKRLRAQVGQLRPEYGLRVTYISTRTVEGAVGDTLGAALDAIARLDDECAGAVLNRLVIQRPVGEWQELSDIG